MKFTPAKKINPGPQHRTWKWWGVSKDSQLTLMVVDLLSFSRLKFCKVFRVFSIVSFSFSFLFHFRIILSLSFFAASLRLNAYFKSGNILSNPYYSCAADWETSSYQAHLRVNILVFFRIHISAVLLLSLVWCAIFWCVSNIKSLLCILVKWFSFHKPKGENNFTVCFFIFNKLHAFIYCMSKKVTNIDNDIELVLKKK